MEEPCFLQVSIRTWLTPETMSLMSLNPVRFLRPEPSPATTELSRGRLSVFPPSSVLQRLKGTSTSLLGWSPSPPLPSPVASSTCLFFFSEFLGKQASGEEDRCQERRGKGQ